MKQTLTGWLLQELLSDKYQQSAVVRTYEPGEYIFRVGDAGDYMGVLTSGRIDIRKGDKSLSIGEAGTMFGEMGLIDRQPRAADVLAASHCKVMEIREGQFMALVEKNPPFSLCVMRLLTERLRQQTDA